MCSRVSLRARAEEFDEDLRHWGVLLKRQHAQRYNITPTQELLIVRNDTEGKAEPCLAQWGFTSPMDVRLGLFNARAETVSSKPSFRQSFLARRCLVLVDGFYEWQKTGRERQPYHFTVKGRRVIALAGLWQTRDAGIGTTIITVDANELVGRLHNRMPAILAPEVHQRWLESKASPEELQALLRPYPSEYMQSMSVSTYVNRVGNEGPECLKPVSPAPSLFD